jgi:D-alanine-D-alanine ligase-like ATP-grasp enzyme
MKKRSEGLMLGQLLKRIGKNMGARVTIEPEWRVAGQIVFPGRAGRSGKKRYFRYNTLDLNPVGASDIAKDKDYATYFMKQMGYPTVPGRTFFSGEWCRAIGSKRDIDAAYTYARKLGFPVIVKPNSGSQGSGVSLVHTKSELYRALRGIFKGDRVALVQRPVRGRDYRVVVLDSAVISAYERVPLNITGDGRSTILGLLKKKSRAFSSEGRDTRIDVKDPRILAKLKYQGRSLLSVPEKDERVFLLDNANLSSGGDSIDVTRTIHPLFNKVAVALTRDMGLRMCGVDLMVDGDIRDAPKKYTIIEINAAPGLDHYVTSGPAQKKIVEDLYLKVLKSLEK